MVITRNMKFSATRHAGTAGFSLIELNVATGMISAFVAAVMMMNANLLGIIKTAKESCSANQALQERVEQMRIANWTQITDANYIAANLLNTATGSAVGLPKLVETLTVTSPAHTSLPPAS